MAKKKPEHWYDGIMWGGIWRHLTGLVVMGFGGIIAMQLYTSIQQLLVFIGFLFISFTITMFAFHKYYYGYDED